MNPRVQTFRRVASQKCSDRSYPFRNFMSAGLEDILEEADAGGWPAQEIAAQVLARCCIEDGRFNNFVVGFLTVATYLNEQFGNLGHAERQAFRDLVAILNGGGQIDAIRKWMETHYRG
jgi:hypothetical protein